MQWWQVWDRLSIASHPYSVKGDHEVSGWASMAFLVGVAWALFVLAWALLRKPKRKADKSCPPS